MRLPRKCFALLLLLCGASASNYLWAHADPGGDTHPKLEVVNGNFSVSFQTDSGNMETYPTYSRARVFYAPDGKIVVPRHRLEPQTEPKPRVWIPERSKPAVVVETVTGRDLTRFVLVSPGSDGVSHQDPLALEPIDNAIVLDSTVTNSSIGFTWTRMINPLPQPFWAPKSELHLAHVDANGYQTGSTVQLGHLASEYGTGTTPPVWAGGHWWIAWVREALTPEERNDPLKRWQTVLSHFDPSNKSLHHQVLEGISNWNTSIQLKTTGGWLCAAWHASEDGSYPGIARIYTAFIRVPARDH
jgi:hypothetical protein